MPNSMTGFARKELQTTWGSLSCEIRSVNHRYLEPTIRLPEALRSLEPHIREQCREQLHRGKVEVNLQLGTDETQDQSLVINQALLQQLASATSQVNQVVTAMGETPAPVNALQVLQWPGVIEPSKPDSELIQTQACALITDTLALLVEHRHREGLKLQTHIEQRLASISECVARVREQMPQLLLAQQDKLQQKLHALTQELDSGRLEQEIVLLTNKADLDEELDRLDTHVGEVHYILKQTGAIGRRLDFMMQELNREANTLSSKSIDADTTQTAVSLKVLIEQMREQIQNIE